MTPIETISRLLLACTAAIGCLVAAGAAPKHERVVVHASVENYDWQTGDLVYRREPGLISAASAAGNATGAQASHVGIVEVDELGAWVWHAAAAEGEDPGGVRRERLASFFARSALVQHQAIGQRLRPHDKEDLVRFLRDADGLPFDEHFDQTTRSALYCTELVLRALRAAGKDLPAVETVFNVPFRGLLHVVTVEEIQRVASELASVTTH